MQPSRRSYWRIMAAGLALMAVAFSTFAGLVPGSYVLQLRPSADYSGQPIMSYGDFTAFGWMMFILFFVGLGTLGVGLFSFFKTPKE